MKFQEPEYFPSWFQAPALEGGFGRQPTYTLAVFGNLEDPSGNPLNGHFESPGAAPEPVAADAYIPLKTNRTQVTHKRRP